ncbi:MAG: hypothetical protein H6732_06695 [Alphaproteobacteria bacterium]|nr:hypothetical protein [Alphaproteobacteria bacterium]
MRVRLAWLGLLAACTAPEPEAPDDTVAEPEGIRQRYDPDDPDELWAFPDDGLAVVDASTSTGLRLEVGRRGWTASLPSLLARLPPALDGRDGFGRLGGIVLRFDEDLGEVPAHSEPGGSWRLLDLSVDPAQEVAFSTLATEDRTQVIVQPERPLAPAALHAFVITTDHLASDGRPLVPSSLQRGLLRGEAAAGLEHLVPRLQTLRDRSGLATEELGAFVVFTTHDGVAALARTAAALQARPVAWAERRAWTADGDTLEKTQATFDAVDARDGLEGAPTWRLTVDMWRPKGATGPLPVVLFGHGMNGSRSEGRTLARRLGELGFVTVSADAVEHGDHPTAADNEALDALPFLGIDLKAVVFDAAALRDSFVQTVLDRLQLLALLRADPDLDGDGSPDLDTSRVGYAGISLGGLLGPGVLAFDGTVDAATLSVGGGHLIAFATDTEVVKILRPGLESLFDDEGGLDRALALGQAAVDDGDPAVLAAHVLRQRVGPGAAPHVLLPVATDDEVVPPATGKMLARGLGLPHVPPVAEVVPGLEVSGPAPLQGNLDGLTAGFFQLDRVTKGDGVEIASHSNTPWSDEGLHQLRAWFQSWLEEGTPRIVDPYADLGTAPRGE